MKTSTYSSLSIRRACTIRDAARPLASTGRKIRAKDALPANPPAAGASELAEHEQAVIDAAMAILRHRLRQPSAFIDNLGDAKAWVKLHLATQDRECFLMLFLDTQSRVIATEEIARGTLMQTAVYPREVVRAAMRHNAASVIFAHNHPSGSAEPSRADIMLTSALKRALALVDVKTLNHLVIGCGELASLAEMNQI